MYYIKIFNYFINLIYFLLATEKEIVYNVKEYVSLSDALCSIFVNERNVYMSASNKKKLRKEQEFGQLTARQQQEQAEAKKLKIYTISFLSAMILIACTVAVILGVRFVKTSGIVEKSTTAATIGNRKLNTVELNYYYIDAINEFYNQFTENYSSNADTFLKAIYGLDPALPLDQQYTDEAKTETWATYFINQAMSQAQNDYAMYDLAKAEKFTLSESSKSSLDSTVNMLETYATIYGYKNANQYLSAIYGNGATLRSYKEYFERSLIASEYYTAHKDTFVYTNEQREAYQADKMATFNSYSYTSCYLTYTDFRVGTTTNGSTTYSDAQNEEGRKKMAEYAEKLKSEITNKEDLENAIKTAPVASGKKLSVTEEKDVLHGEVSTGELRDWLADAKRKPGDIGAIAIQSTSTDANGNEVKTTNGYYVVIFNGVSDNATAMANIGYIFVPYADGVENEETGEVSYTQEGKDKAHTAADGYLKQWLEGAKTSASFDELATKLIKEKKANEGGLFENLNPASSFDSKIIDWALDTKRVANETTVIEANDGFYILVYTGKSEMNYRHYMIDNEMRSTDYTNWYNDAISKVTTAVGNTSKMDLSIVLNPSAATSKN